MQEPPSVTLILWVSQQIIIHENFTTKLYFWCSTTSEQKRNCRNYVSTRDRVYKGRAVENCYFLSTLNSYKLPLHVGETPFDWNESAVTNNMARSTRMQQNISLFTLLPKFTFHDFAVKRHWICALVLYYDQAMFLYLRYINQIDHIVSFTFISIKCSISGYHIHYVISVDRTSMPMTGISVNCNSRWWVNMYNTVKLIVYDTPNSKTLMFFVSSCSCFCPIRWSQVLSREWRCSWSSADRRCFNYIWVINNFNAY